MRQRMQFAWKPLSVTGLGSGLSPDDGLPYVLDLQWDKAGCQLVGRGLF